MTMKWAGLRPDPLMVTALDNSAPRPPDTGEKGLQNEKKNWSNRFADECAKMVAEVLRRQQGLARLSVFPTPAGEKVEYVTAAQSRGKGKKVDVAVSSMAAGLQMACSLKAGNFEDTTSAGYGKNLTGRLYELLDETRAVHEYHPHSMIVAMYFFPLQATEDLKTRSTFAKAVQMLRAHTDRSDPLLVTQFARFDHAAIVLYVPEDVPDGPERGACRVFDVSSDPPKMGRPKIETTETLLQFGRRMVNEFKSGESHEIDYVDPE